jgi:hypothetical protein
MGNSSLDFYGKYLSDKLNTRFVLRTRSKRLPTLFSPSSLPWSFFIIWSLLVIERHLFSSFGFSLPYEEKHFSREKEREKERENENGKERERERRTREGMRESEK